ncbi:Sodium/calcium exchanger protein-domain-containing protein [Russula ochroleuca]|uniref:Sodium/calcium exchanger protein-domain-containing protein n=1 Tax=Russula ochroleuca TaxID=152965 RepID=A0A9P5TD90_9AGAM|nr:Sodium/calcium exchanger protein-domain-containing protein [Russula ochroleuca]
MALVTDEKQHELPKVSLKPWEGWRVVLLSSWFNLLLFFLPASWTVDSLSERSHTIVFTFCILSMIPLVKLHDLAIRELAIRLGGSKAGLLNASLVRLPMDATALRKCELRVVQSSLIGSMLSKLLMVLGMCFFAGGLRFAEQGFDATATQIHSSLLSISVGAVLMPAAYHYSLSWRSDTSSTDQKSAILKMSHGVSVVLVIVYCAYLLFQLWSHTYLFEDPDRSNRLAVKRPRLHQRLSQFRAQEINGVSSAESSPSDRTAALAAPQGLGYKRCFPSASDVSLPMASGTSSSLGYVYTRGTTTPAPVLGSTVKLVRDGRCTVTSLPSGEELHSASHVNLCESANLDQVCDDESGIAGGEKTSVSDTPDEEKPRLSWTLTLSLLVSVTILVAINAESLVESMDKLSGSISKEWIALILLPMMNCIAECMTAINVSRKDRLSLSISVAVGSTIQTALFVIPFMVILGWVLDKPLPLLFDPFESIVLYISVHIMTNVVADGKSNWLEGAILICFYINIAVSFWFYPGSTYSSTLGRCTADLR